ncbi:transglycosylase domain-containing protein [Tessaracoccus sp. OH4464_COT-324]|uniref:transglycosylase domain-containing protein n=1 Tax=Tessaracoccus sp. OH4464_COT-324 TaxID=2491059 RepID=UPI001319C06C|nr:transglycosylase domain-containing protein [Tessaracoccus sp. OH4464_COT-324]
MKSAKLSQKAYAAFMFLLVSLLSGVLLAGVAVPFVAMASGLAREAASSIDRIPTDFRPPPQSQRSRILMANDEVLATFFDENRIYVKLPQISQHMRDAQVAIEDHRFYRHGAIDPEGFARAFVRNLAGDTQGASTLTQQYVKLVRLEQARAAGDKEAERAAVEVTIERKIIEARAAFAVEERMSKDEILEGYLNIAYYGNGAYGVEAAALTYFGVHAADLTLDQAALLAGIVQNPVAYDPVRQTERALKRRSQVLLRMQEENYITKEQADAAREAPFDVSKVARTPNGCTTARYPFLCDYVVRAIAKGEVPALGDTPEERVNRLRRGGLTIKTLIDPATQDAAEAAVAELVAPTDPVIANAVLLQPSSGLIVAMAQSRPKMGDQPGETWFNYNVQGGKNGWGGAEGYQSGSTMKVFAAAAALEAGLPVSHTIDAPGKLTDLAGKTMKGCGGTDRIPRNYKPGNLGGRGYGPINMVEATKKSVNTYFLRLTHAMGNCPAVEMALKTGVVLANGEDMRTRDSFNASWVLGTSYVTPLSMAEGYATFANRGTHCKPRILQSITTDSGNEIPVPSDNCKQVVDPEVADGVSHLLSAVMGPGGTGNVAAIRDGRPQAGKTGTTNGSQAVWFAGYTPEMAGVAMIAVDTAAKENRPKSLDGFRLQTGERLQGTGGGDAGRIWRAAMTSSVRDLPKTPFTKIGSRVQEGKKVPVPSVAGLSYNQAKEVLENAGFNTRHMQVYSSRAPGTFLGITPSVEAPMHSTISLRVSGGPRPQPKPEEQAPANPPDGGSEGDN